MATTERLARRAKSGAPKIPTLAQLAHSRLGDFGDVIGRDAELMAAEVAQIHCYANLEEIAGQSSGARGPALRGRHI